MPVYNSEKYLGQCLESILGQYFRDWECILIDDGSTDRSGVICDAYSGRDSRFYVIHQNNGGVSAARNAGIEAASGEWICFVDSDDRLEKGALTYMLDHSASSKADAYICTIVKDKQPAEEILVLDELGKKQLIWSCLAYRTDWYASKGFMVDAPHAKLFRASIIRDFQLRYVVGLCKSEDALFDAQFYHHSDCVVMDTHPVYRYTINPTSISHTYNLEKIPMFGILMLHEKRFVDKWYSGDTMFDNILEVRAFVALEQVLYEAGAERLSFSDRIRSLRIFMDSDSVGSVLSATKYSEISSHINGRSKRIDLFLIRKRMFRSLCLWIGLRQLSFRLRVSLATGIKRFLHLDQNTPLISVISR